MKKQNQIQECLDIIQLTINKIVSLEVKIDELKQEISKVKCQSCGGTGVQFVTANRPHPCHLCQGKGYIIKK